MSLHLSFVVKVRILCCCRWVHTVCALYTQDVEFGSVEKLSPIILSKIPESRWDSRVMEFEIQIDR